MGFLVRVRLGCFVMIFMMLLVWRALDIVCFCKLVWVVKLRCEGLGSFAELIGCCVWDWLPMFCGFGCVLWFIFICGAACNLIILLCVL